MSKYDIEIPERPERKFLPEDFKVTDWEGLKPYFEELLERDISSEEDLRKWFQDRSELEAVLSEDAGWRYINMTCYTEDEDKREAYTYFVKEIQPKMAPISDQLNRKAVDSPYLESLENAGDGYDIMIRSMRKAIEIYREKNIPLFTELQTLKQQYEIYLLVINIILE